MAKEEMYHIALDDYEHGIIIRSLNDEKTDLMNEGKSTDAVDDLIIKVGTAPKKKFKVIENADTAEDFTAYVEKCKKLSLYETGITAEYGDKLLTLSTCEYSRTNGRLVVVAKLINE